MEPHTKAKHTILENYLKAWFPIISKNTEKIIYFDGFAGPGIYDDGSPGSPIISLNVAKNHTRFIDLADEIIFYFVEIEKDRAKHLENLIEKSYKAQKDDKGWYTIDSKLKVSIVQDDFNNIIGKILDNIEKEKANLAPTFVFVDPFGYKEIIPKNLARVLYYKKCELLITYMVGFMDRFLSDKLHGPIDSILGLSDQQLRNIEQMPDKEDREMELLRALNDRILSEEKKLDDSSSEIYHIYFKVKDKQNNTMYYLVYFTKSITGMRVMKDAMFNVGNYGRYFFTDYGFVKSQTSIIDYTNNKFWHNQAAEYLVNTFRGQTVTMREIESQIILKSPWIWRKHILSILEQTNKITVDRGNSRKNSYPDDARIKFK
ncbi:MAG: three-Cys-motif partner protein TcmP [Desulfomonilaceae bacterium]